MKFLITGSSGQLARDFAARFEANGAAFAAPPEAVLDITDPKAIDTAIVNSHPDVVLNCAACNAVEAAENDPSRATAINAHAISSLALACRKHQCLLVHYGTDYVFDGESDRPYVETDATNPINEYGKSKLAGEKALACGGIDFLLLRVSWVYGQGTQNFLYKMQKWAEGRSSISVVTDQVSVPTYTADIVTYTLQAIAGGLRGLYHLTNSGYASRYEVADLLFKSLGGNMTVLPADSGAFPSPVKRPAFSAMDNGKLSTDLGIEIPTWQNAIERFCAEGAGDDR